MKPAEVSPGPPPDVRIPAERAGVHRAAGMPPEADPLSTPLHFATATLPNLSAVRQRRRARRHLWGKLVLLLYDALGVTLAFYAAYFIRFNLLQGVTFDGASSFVTASLSDLAPFQMALVAGMALILALRGMYRLRPTGNFIHQASLFFVASTACFAGFSIYEFFFRATEFELVKDTRAIVIFSWLTAVAVPLLGRLALALLITLAHRLGIGRTRLLVIGAGRAGKLIMQHLAAAPGLGYRIIGFLGDDPAQGDFGRFTLLGTLAEADRVIRAYRIGEVIIALPSAEGRQIARAINLCERLGITFRLVPDMDSLSLARVDLETVGGIPLFALRRATASQWQRAVKRLLDIIIAAAVLLLGSPLWLALTVIIRLDSPGPAIFRQLRIGQLGRPFISYKFRSMIVGADTRRPDLAAENLGGRGLFKLKRDPRCTRVGRWLRRLSLDEIPQLWNVLRGEMSLVGPRPPLPDEVASYEEWEKRRLDVPPGLTGLWQVRGRSDISFDEMVLMDLYYAENWSLRLDAEILLKTIPVVIFRRGAY
jgi:exopolysaccharide biosynthesis polyprenyl glycosylphosphotransferase